MYRNTKWKLEKTKVKVVFRLQFHATHIPQTGWEKLYISFIPIESGKVTAKTTKANVRKGTCKWGDPIYETTRLLLDARSKLFDDKIYKLVVGMGSSRSSILGEAIINLADYADALKPYAVALPLHGTDAGTILHVTLQLLTSNTGFREFEQQRELRETGLPIGSNLNRHDESGTAKATSSEQKSKDQTDKVDAKIKSTKESKLLPSLEEVGESEEFADSQVGCDGSSNTSRSLYADKHDTSSTHENDWQRSLVSEDLNRQTAKEGPSDHHNLANDSNEWVQGWISNYSVDSNLAVDSEENKRLQGSLEVADESSIFELKLELSSLQSHAEEIGLETQKLADQLVVEITSGQELAKEVSVLKSQCSKFKDDFEQLISKKLSPKFANMESNKYKQDPLLQDKQIRWLNGLLVVENQIREVQEKACMGLHDTDFNVLHSDLQALLQILQDLINETAEVVTLPGTISTEGAQLKDRAVSLRKSEYLVPKTGLDIDLYEHESIFQYVGLPSLVPHLPESTRDTEALAGKILELLQQLDEAKVEKEALVRRMDQMECYYEALVQELEENQKQMLLEFHSLRNDHSTCLYTISANKVEMESLRHDMNEQALQFTEERLQFAEERLALDSLNKELEKRVITSEAALKRARLNYSIAVNQLQNDLDLLSFQVSSMFETNQNLINDAFSEPSQLLCQGYPNIVQNSLKSNDVIILQDQNQTAGVKNDLLGADNLSDDLKKSLCLQEDLYQKVEVELWEMCSANLYLDIFSNTLKETLLEASTDIRVMKKKIDEYAQQLEFFDESRSLLVARLQTAVEDIHVLNEDKVGCLAQCNHLLLQNQILEAKLESVSNENFFLTEKLIDCEARVLDYRGYEAKYEACFTEKSELENCLELENLERGIIQKEMSSLKEEFQILKDKCDELAVYKESAQNVFTFLRDKMMSLLTSNESIFDELSSSSSSLGHNMESKEIKGIIRDLEESQQKVCEKMVKLIEEKKCVENERDIAAMSLSTARFEVLGMKKKFKNDIQDMVAKVDISISLVEKLQLQFESVANRFQMSSSIEEKYLQHGEELLAYLASLELELQKMSSKNGELAQDNLGLGIMAEELERCKLTISELMQENQNRTKEIVGLGNLDAVAKELGKTKIAISELQQENKELLLSLQGKTDESYKLVSKLDRLADEHRRSKLIISEFMLGNQDLELSLQSKTEESIKLKSELDRFADELGGNKLIISELVQEKEDLTREILGLKTIAEELGGNKSIISELMQEKEDFVRSLQSKYEESIKFESELDRVTEELGRSKLTISNLMQEKWNLSMAFEIKTEEFIKLESELHRLADELERSESQLTKEQKKLVHFDRQNADLVHFRQLASDLESENFRSRNLLLQHEEMVEKLQKENCSFSALGNQLIEMEENVISADVKLCFIQTQYKTFFQELVQQLQFSNEHCKEMEKKKLDAEATVGRSLASEAQCNEENEKLSRTLKSLIAELEASAVQNGVSSDANNVITAELIVLRDQCNDLTEKLSEQILKTEEFKKLSIDLKELKDKADAESALAREKKESEWPSIAVQESLRIAFMKEQYETKLLELRQELSMSKRHGEEILFKLQDAIDENENRKKSEVSHLKKNEELALKVLEMEAELQSVISDKRERINAYDRIKTELECTLLSLECCKEEKEKLNVTLQKCEEEKSKMLVELSLTKVDQRVSSGVNAKREENGGIGEQRIFSDDLMTRKVNQQNLMEGMVSLERGNLDDSASISSGNPFPVDGTSVTDSEGVQETSSVPISEVQHPADQLSAQSIQGSSNSEGVDGTAERVFEDKGNLLLGNCNRLAVVNDHFRAQTLRSSMEHLDEELERMKNENSLLSMTKSDPTFQDLHKEMLKLQKANQELASIYPLFNDLTGTGNALERVLALEIELAEALRAKKKSSIQFQSSFLKQHSDEEAVFKSFRDINELIRDMLELKGKYTNVETELKDMHDRYSQLSLQFAEVEGERQKLIMTLKNVRASKKQLHLNRSSSATVDQWDHPL